MTFAARCRSLLPAACALALGLVPAATLRAQIPEPDTVVYGRVLNRSSAQPAPVTAGVLAWQVRAASGSGVLASGTAALAPLAEGAFSYRFKVPHEALVAALPSTGQALPLGVTDTLYRVLTVTIDGAPASVSPSYTDTVALRQANRARTVRLDLDVFTPLPDTDGDGLPDWWETQYGLDPLVANSTADTDGDGFNHLQEYLAGTHPRFADTAPRFPADLALSLPRGGRAALLLAATDADTPPAQLIYTLTRAPAGARLVVHHGAFAGGDRTLATGGVFTQAEINQGRVVLTHADSAATDLSFDLSLTDGTSGHAVVTATLSPIVLQLPATATDTPAARTLARLLAAAAPQWPARTPADYVLQDASRESAGRLLRAPGGPALAAEPLAPAAYAAYAQAYGPDAPRLQLGGPGPDTLLGSGEGDLLVSGGGTDTLRGYVGADRFVLAPTGDVSLLDFSPGEGDVLDLTEAIVPGAATALASYLQVTSDAGLPALRLLPAGTVARFPAGTDFSSPATLTDLWDRGTLVAPAALAPATYVSLEASVPLTREAGLPPAKFTARRAGRADAALTVPLTLLGTATAGVDYTSLPSAIVFPAGVKTVELLVSPVADTTTEALETVELTLAAGSTYALRPGAASATVQIGDPVTRVRLEIVERIGYKDGLQPAQLLLRREGATAASLTVRLAVTGKAAAGVDYVRIAAVQQFSAGQDTLFLNVQPLASASLANGLEDVNITVLADAAYELGAPAAARVLLAERIRTLDQWMTEKLPPLPGAPARSTDAALRADDDGDGVPNLVEFALARDPRRGESTDGGPAATLEIDAEGRPNFAYARSATTPEVGYRVQFSTNLVTWTDVGAADFEEINEGIDPAGREKIRVRRRAPAPAPSTFYRLVVDRP